MERHLAGLLRAATRIKRHAYRQVPLFEELHPATEYDHDTALDALDAIPRLTQLERDAVSAFLSGGYRSDNKQMDNALRRARDKLRR